MKAILSFLVIGVVLAGVAFNTACESQSASDNTLRVEPQAIGIVENQAIDFTASGGFSYTWSLSDSSLGVLTTKTGPNTRYISRFNPVAGSGVKVQILTVTSDLGPEFGRDSSGQTTTVTRTSGFTETAEAVIEHLPTGETASAVTTTDTSTTSSSTSAALVLATTTSSTAPFLPPLP